MILWRITYTNPESPDKQRVLITSLTDPAIPAADIVAKYTRRWDIELRIREIKTIMGLHIARSKTPDGVYKEIAAALIVYNITRELVTESVHPDFSPLRISFKNTIRVVRNHLQIKLVECTTGDLRDTLQKLKEQISRQIISERPNRSYPRRLKQGGYKKYKKS